jgi:hypothetical protein
MNQMQKEEQGHNQTVKLLEETVKRKEEEYDELQREAQVELLKRDNHIKNLKQIRQTVRIFSQNTFVTNRNSWRLD